MKKIYPKMNQLIPDLSYLHNGNSCTDFGDGYSLLRCRPEAMSYSLTTKMSMLTLRHLCRPGAVFVCLFVIGLLPLTRGWP